MSTIYALEEGGDKHLLRCFGSLLFNGMGGRKFELRSKNRGQKIVNKFVDGSTLPIVWRLWWRWWVM